MSTRRTALSRMLAPTISIALPTVFPIVAHGQSDYPNRPITVIVPFGAGGAVQALTERLGPDLRREMGQPLVSDFKGGSGGLIAGETAARALPNGYTLLLGTPSALAASPAVHKNAKYNPVTDFVPVALVAMTPFVLAINANLPVRNLQELVAYGKANPDKLNFASAGVGSMDHIGGEVLQRMAGFKMTHIPYKGPGASVLDLVSGRIDCLISSPIPMKPHVDSGKVRLIAVTSSRRSSAMIDVPTIKESGFPDYEMNSWYAYVAPTGTPRDVVNKLNAAVRKALTNPETLTYLAGFGLTPAPTTPEELGKLLIDESKRWIDWVRVTGVQAE